MKILVEVDEGVVVNITATDEVSIYLVDQDNIKERDGDIEDAKQAFQPDRICDEDEFTELLNESLGR
ncbi:hypothetical protein KAR91_24510 [Candidatus Pacearchaeota archaeon]|nr:hypothetical protein [Candidatus Pacearchaeota archaeon]